MGIRLGQNLILLVIN